MAIIDTRKKPYIVDRDERVSIGIDLPFRKSNDSSGWFETTSTTIEAIKTNIKNLLNTNPGERLFQPTLGMNLRKYLFEPMNEESQILIQNEIIDTFKFWLPFVEIRDISVHMRETEGATGSYEMNLSMTFNIKQDPNTLESVQIVITGED